MINNLFIDYTTAKELKELGFDEICLGYYYHENDYTKCNPQIYFKDSFTLNIDGYISPTSCKAPLYQQVFQFFRERKINSTVQEYDINNYCFCIDDGINKDIESKGYLTYREAEDACIKQLILLAKQQNK